MEAAAAAAQQEADAMISVDTEQSPLHWLKWNQCVVIEDGRKIQNLGDSALR
jgi:hypothetical protein